MSTFEKIRETMANQLGVEEEEITLDSHLQDDLNADPLSLTDLVGNLETAFEIKIAQEDYLKFKTVRDIVEYVSDQIGDV